VKCPQCRSENPEGSRFCANCASPLPQRTEPAPPSQTQAYAGPPDDLTRGSLFAGRYEVIEELGSGGMGRVYKVYDNKLNETVALKLIRPELAFRPKTLARFREEIRLARRITHKHVCRMYDFSEEQGTPFITMEYIQGEDLKSIIRMVGKLSPAQALFIAGQVCAGLAEAHRLGIVHRDLKPRNIIINREGNARIMDFGLARSLGEKGLTDGSALIGTPEYMSPEQAEGTPADARSDIYTLGVVLFEMLTGKVPFEGDSALSIALKHKTERPPDPRKLNPQVTEPLARIISRCLEKDKAKRYQTVAELQAELESLAGQFPRGEKILPRKPSSILTGIARPFRSKRVLLAATSILIFVALSLIVWRHLAKEAALPARTGTPSLAVLYFKNSTGDRELDFFRETLVDYLIPELRGATRKITTLSEDAIKSVLSRLKLEGAAGYSTEDLEAVAAKTRASYILTATYFKIGDSLEIKYTLSDVRKAQSIGEGSVQGREQDYDQLVARLAQKVLADLRLPGTAPVPAQPAVPLEAQRFYQLARQAERKYNEGRDIQYLRQALDYYNQALAEKPRFALAYVGLGDLYETVYIRSQQREDYEKALQYYTHAYELDPESAETNAGLGWAYYLKGDNDGAFSFFKKAFQLDPENPAIDANIGSFFRSIGLPGEAARFYSNAIDRGGLSAASFGASFEEIHRMRATCYERLGEFDRAVADARTLLEIEPDNIGAELFYARMLISRRTLREAEREIGVVERVDPGNPNLGYTRALLFAARGEKDKALPLIEEAKKQPFYYCYLLSRVYAGCGLKDEAIQVIRLGMERGFEEQQEYLYEYPVLAGSFFFDSLRGDPRFREILDRQKSRYEENLKKYGGL
jgi:serine/threonine protein kinase/tetratricopeptide (TPR) repeat protein